MGSAIGMDKLRTMRLAHAIGVATADYVVLRGQQDFEIAIERLGVPMIVKPASQGSSVGMSKVEKASDLPAAYAAAARVGASVFAGPWLTAKTEKESHLPASYAASARVEASVSAEPWITGKEYTVAVLHYRALPSIR